MRMVLGIKTGSDASQFNGSFIVQGIHNWFWVSRRVAMRASLTVHSLCRALSSLETSVHKPTSFDETDEPKRTVEPGSFRLPAERLTTN